jgi:hypothetical protein
VVGDGVDGRMDSRVDVGVGWFDLSVDIELAQIDTCELVSPSFFLFPCVSERLKISEPV